MRKLAIVTAVVCALAVLPGLVVADAFISNVTPVDVETGTVVPGQSVRIEGTAITAIGPDLAVPDGASVLDGSGGYLIPGLWASHVHIFSTTTEPETALPHYLINGVTGISDTGALWPIDEQKAPQARIEAGEVARPRLILSGGWVDASASSWPGMILADTPEDARAVVDRIAAESWAAVKSYSMLDEPTHFGLAAAARDGGLPLVGHVPERVSLGTAIAAGQAGIEHLGRIPMACSTREVEMLHALEPRLLAEGEKVSVALGRLLSSKWSDLRPRQGVGASTRPRALTVFG